MRTCVTLWWGRGPGGRQTATPPRIPRHESNRSFRRITTRTVGITLKLLFDGVVSSVSLFCIVSFCFAFFSYIILFDGVVSSGGPYAPHHVNWGSKVYFFLEVSLPLPG